MPRTRATIHRHSTAIALGALAAAATLAVTAAMRFRSEGRSAPVRGDSADGTRNPTALHGRVRWPDGRAAGGARVSLYPSDAGLGDSEIVADADGTFRFTVVPSTTYSVAARIFDTHGPLPKITAVAQLDRLRGGDREIDLTLVRLLPIRGTVVDSAKRPLSDVLVEAKAPVGSVLELPGRQQRGLSAAGGRFEVWVVEGDAVDLEAVRQSAHYDMITEVGPRVRLSGIRPGADDVVVSMPDDH
jgi:hypothetical protein